MKTKGERIKQLREDANMTQEELAKYLDTTKQTIHKYENNIVTNIPSDKIEIIAEVLNSDPSYIMGWTSSIQFDSTGHFLSFVTFYTILFSLQCQHFNFM